MGSIRVTSPIGSVTTTWASGVWYAKDRQVVNSNGDLFICSVGHLSAAATEAGIGAQTATVWTACTYGMTANQNLALNAATALDGTHPPLVKDTTLSSSVTDNSNPALTIAQVGTGKILALKDGATTVVNVPDGGGVGINTGDTAPVTALQVVDTVITSPRGIMSSQYSTGTDGARLHMRKGRGTLASPTTVVTGDTLGKLVASGYDGTNYLEMGAISVEAEGTIASTRVPTRIVFSTATDAAPSVLTERMRIDRAGVIVFNPTLTTGRVMALVPRDSGVTNIASVSFYPYGGTNVTASLDLIPKGTGYSSSFLANFSLWNTDFIADGTNWERMSIRSMGTSGYNVFSERSGTGVLRSIEFNAKTNSDHQLYLATDNNVLIGTTTSSAKLYCYDNTTTAQPVLKIYQDNASNSNAVATITGDGTGDLLQCIDGSTTVFTVRDGGYVGINYASPTVALQLHQTVASNAQLIISNDGTYHTGLMATGAGAGNWGIDQYAWGMFGGPNNYLTGLAYRVALMLPTGVPDFSIVTGGTNLNSVNGSVKFSVSQAGGCSYYNKEIVEAATVGLTAAKCMNGIVNNYGQGAEATYTLPAAAAGLGFMLIISTAGAGAVHVKAAAGDKIYLDGTPLDDADKVSLATPAVGNAAKVWAFQTGSGAYDWYFQGISGTYTDGGA